MGDRAMVKVKKLIHHAEKKELVHVLVRGIAQAGLHRIDLGALAQEVEHLLVEKEQEFKKLMYNTCRPQTFIHLADGRWGLLDPNQMHPQPTCCTAILQDNTKAVIPLVEVLGMTTIPPPCWSERMGRFKKK